jgi:pyruvate dehydrogenase E2 component (dihydrolipoamide acetyltransferase)
MAEVVSMPKLGFDMAEGTLVRWVISEDESVEKGAVLAEIETDKATIEVESSFSGIVRRHLIEEGTTVPVGDAIAIIGDKDEEIDLDALIGGEKVVETTEEAAPEQAESKKPEVVGLEAAAEAGHLPEGVRVSPLARRMAEEKGIDLSRVSGSGPHGRIVKADIEAYQEVEPAPIEGLPMATPTMVSEIQPDRRVQLSRLRATIGRRMTTSAQNIPHIFVTRVYDMGPVMELRSQINALLQEEEKTSVNDYIVKAVALALREHPSLNASLDEKKGEILQHGQINVGVAVATESGLLTVVSHDSDQKPLRFISAELKAMVSRVRQGKVRPGDIEGSTFTVSNLGMFGVEHFTAIINPPEAAILAIGMVREEPVVVEGDIKPGLRMRTTLSVDHRVSDGADGAQFLQTLAKYLEEPLRLMV